MAARNTSQPVDRLPRNPRRYWNSTEVRQRDLVWKNSADAFKHESLRRRQPIIRQHVAGVPQHDAVLYAPGRNRCRSQTSSSEKAPKPAMLSETCAIAFSRLSLPRLLPASATMALLGR